MVLNTSAHGDSGPIQVGFSEYIFDEVAKWIPAWETLGLSGKDLAGGSTHGAMISTSTINMQNQTRSDSKAGYIDPLPPRSNLVILTNQQVTSVIFNGSTDASGNIIASGVTFQADASSASYSVQANKEVLLAYVNLVTISVAMPEANSNLVVELLAHPRSSSSRVLGPKVSCLILPSTLKLTCPLVITSKITFRTLCIGPLRKSHVHCFLTSSVLSWLRSLQ